MRLTPRCVGQLAVAATVGLGSLAPALAQWVEFVDETATRLVAAGPVGAVDRAEKDYAYGDIDNDGDIDLVVVRKEPFTSAGKRANVLLLNEGGVLVDRTAQYATASDVPGDQGFATPTNDRDVQLTDVDVDGWLDVVTATTISDGDPKHLGHPRVYINLGRDLESGTWRGLRYEDGRIPALLTWAGEAGYNPRFCGVAAGDVDGDDHPDLYFSDYDSGQFGPAEASVADFNDKLLINDGTGYFSDETADRFRGMLFPPGFPGQPFEVSEFGAAAAIADLNGDGRAEIIKQTSLVNPLIVAVAYGDPNRQGEFDTYQTVDQNAPYFFSVGDLNNDTLPDVVISDDGTDRYLLNGGADRDGIVDFEGFNFSYVQSDDAGFNNNSRIADLNNDGFSDVLIAGMDIDRPNCGIRMNIYRNLGGPAGGDVVLQEQITGTGCAPVGSSDTCLVAGIPSTWLNGVFDLAVFDLDGNGWQDLVLGTCTGTRVLMNIPPEGLVFSYGDGLPAWVPPGGPTTFRVEVAGYGVAVPEPGSAAAWLSVDGGPFEGAPSQDLGDNVYEITLPPITRCGADLRFYVTARTTSGETYTDPPGAPAESYGAVAALGRTVTFEDDIEDVSGWTVHADPATTAGFWQRVEPVGTLDSFGNQAAPDDDAEGAAHKVHAWVTHNGEPGQPFGETDVDGGPVDLMSPPLNVAGADAFISYSRWFYKNIDIARPLIVSVTSDGTHWETVETVDIAQNGQWTTSSFKVSDFVEPSDRVQVRFRAADQPPTALVEAGVDLLRVERFVCNECAAAAECDDAAFCTGAEQCIAGSCVPSSTPCGGDVCDEENDVCIVPPGSGSVPDGVLPGEPLRLAREAAGAARLDWGASCNGADTDYAVYSGPLGSYAGHAPATCSTGGARTWMLDEAGDRFYLVVPTNGIREGSYGKGSGDAERPPSAAACLPQSVAACGP